MGGVEVFGCGFGDGGEESGGRSLSAVLEHAVQESAHCHEFDAADVEADDAGEGHRLGFFLQDEYSYVVES